MKPFNVSLPEDLVEFYASFSDERGRAVTRGEAMRRVLASYREYLQSGQFYPGLRLAGSVR